MRDNVNEHRDEVDFRQRIVCEACELFLDYKFFNVRTNDRVAIKHTNSQSTNNLNITEKDKKVYYFCVECTK